MKYLYLALCLAVLFTGCSNKPDARDAKIKELEQRVDELQTRVDGLASKVTEASEKFTAVVSSNTLAMKEASAFIDKVDNAYLAVQASLDSITNNRTAYQKLHQ